MERYAREKAKLKNELYKNTLNMIYISFDLWTSINFLILITVVAHYVDLNYKVKMSLIALRRLHEYYSSKNQAELLISIFQDYEITDKIRYFVIDNAKNNDIYVDIVFNRLLPALTFT